MIRTERLILRSWQDSDRAPFAAMGQDAEVMRHLGPLMSSIDSDAAIDRLSGVEASHGYTFWAVERGADGAFLGFCGLKPGPDGTPIAGRTEIGWRIARAYWRQGYALEAARASIEWAWSTLADSKIFAMTVPANVASWGLMERLGMNRLADQDFDHPNVPDGSPLKRHIVYAIDRPDPAETA